VQNYRLADSVVAASAYLKGGNAAQMKAIDVGQTAVQNLQTILEYFDSSDVENIKVRKTNILSCNAEKKFLFCSFTYISLNVTTNFRSAHRVWAGKRSLC
jgi:hypothetical protein